MSKNEKENRLGLEKLNKQGCLMRIVEYNNNKDMTVEFQDEYKTKVYTHYNVFVSGEVQNPYYPSVFGVGVTGNKSPTMFKKKINKEYRTWADMLRRCYDEKYKEKYQTYKNVTCCKEWLLYENFYEWLHSQENFDEWLNGERWAIDKDILVKNNKMYSSETCILVPPNINGLFLKCNATRGNLPIGVKRHGNSFQAKCMNPFTNKTISLGCYKTPVEAFLVYKPFKENIIKQIAEIEYVKGNITKQCYDAMMNYEVEITD